MIYLYTGSNGSGKTLNAIKFICEKLNPDNSRPVFHYSPENQPLNINADKLDWELITLDQARNWFDFPDGAIFYIDECRHVFPFRSNNQRVPDFVDKLSEHRSHGFDFVLTAQKPSAQFDPAIQGFIEEHRHLVAKLGTSISSHYIYQSFCSSPLDPPKLQTVEVQSIPFDKKYYDFYRSASSHTKVNRLPYKKLFLFGLAGVVFLGASIFAVNKILSFSSPVSDLVDSPSVESSSDLSPIIRPVSSGEPVSVDRYLSLRVPRVSDIPHSAPIYDHLTEPSTFPKLSACVQRPSRNTCLCYSQQGTLLNISLPTCLNFVRHGAFDDLLDDEKERSAPADKAEPSAARSRLTSL